MKIRNIYEIYISTPQKGEQTYGKVQSTGNLDGWKSLGLGDDSVTSRNSSFHDRPNRVYPEKKQSQKESSFPYPKNRMQTVKSVSSEHLPLRWHLRSEPEILSVWELPLP